MLIPGGFYDAGAFHRSLPLLVPTTEAETRQEKEVCGWGWNSHGIACLV